MIQWCVISSITIRKNMPDGCENMITTAAETTLNLTESKLAEHQLVVKAGKRADLNKSVISAKVSQA